MENVKTALLALHKKAREATRNRDVAFYEQYLDDNVIAVLPRGIFDKKHIVQQMALGTVAFKEPRTEDVKVIVLSEESGLVTYKQTFTRERDGKEITLSDYVTTIYAKRGGEWKSVFYERTTLEG